MSDPASSESGNPVDVEALADEFLRRRRDGENPSIDDYVAQYPDLEDELREIIPALLAMESLKQDWEDTLHETDRPAGLPVDRLGDYRLLKEIGRGGMGIVYEALQESLGRKVALKLLPKHMVNSPDHVRRLHREAKTAAALHHSNIVPVFGVGAEEEFHYIIMQLIDGASVERFIRLIRSDGADHVAAMLTEPHGSGPLSFALGRLAERIQDSTPTEPDGTLLSGLFSESAGMHTAPELSRFAATTTESESPDVVEEQAAPPLPSLPPSYWRVISHLGIQIADAIEYAHSQGTLHRDIKPGNIMLDQQGTVWITDFGLAHATDGSNATESQHLAGTICYMAPEQFHGKCDVRSDVYALGLTLYEFATLTPAISAGSRAEMIRQATESRPAPPRSIISDLPRDLETIILKAISADASHRYQSAGDLADDLRRFAEDRPIRARRVSVAERIWRWCRRNPMTATSSFIAMTVLVLAAVVSTVAWSREAAQRQKIESMLEISISSLERVYDRFAPDALSTSGYAMITSDEDAASVPGAAALSPEAVAMLEELLPAFDQLSTHFEDNDALKADAAAANRRIGDIHRQLGNVDQAVSAYQDSIRRFEELSGQQPDAAHRVEIARILNRLGNTWRDAQEQDKANASFRKAIELLSASGDVNDDTDSAAIAAQKFELAWTWYHLGRRQLPEQVGPSQLGLPGGFRRPPGNNRARPSPAGAGPFSSSNGQVVPPGRRDARPPRLGLSGDADLLDQAIRLLEQLRRDDDKPAYRFLLALCFRDKSLSFNSAEEMHAIEILEALCTEQPSQPGYRYELSQTYAAFPFPMLRQDELDAALRRLRIALEHMNQLVDEHPNVVTYVFSAAHISHKYSMVLSRSARDAAIPERELVMGEADEMARSALELQKTAIRRSRFGVAESFWLLRFSESYVERLVMNRQFEAGRKVHLDTIDLMQSQLPPENDPRRAVLEQHIQVLRNRLPQ